MITVTASIYSSLPVPGLASYHAELDEEAGTMKIYTPEWDNTPLHIASGYGIEGKFWTYETPKTWFATAPDDERAKVYTLLSERMRAKQAEVKPLASVSTSIFTDIPKEPVYRHLVVYRADLHAHNHMLVFATDMDGTAHIATGLWSDGKFNVEHLEHTWFEKLPVADIAHTFFALSERMDEKLKEPVT